MIFKQMIFKYGKFILLRKVFLFVHVFNKKNIHNKTLTSVYFVLQSPVKVANSEQKVKLFSIALQLGSSITGKITRRLQQ